jgi:hypothetical protein
LISQNRRDSPRQFPSHHEISNLRSEIPPRPALISLDQPESPRDPHPSPWCPVRKHPGKAPPTAGTRPDSSGGPLRPTPARPDRPRPPASAINHEPSTLNRFECQRTTEPVLHSALENRQSQFPRTLPPPGSLREQNAAILIPALRSDSVLAINHQRSTINQLISPFHAPSLAQIAERDYVTLHGLHDLKENKKQQNNPPRWGERTREPSHQPKTINHQPLPPMGLERARRAQAQGSVRPSAPKA